MDSESRSLEHLDRPLLGGSSLFDDEPDYLDYDYKGRPFHEALFFNAGLTFTVGSIGGAAVGAARGLAQAPNNKFRVRLNALLNGAGKMGSRAGNSAGVLAFYYTGFTRLADLSGADDFVGGAVPYFNEISSGFGTGVLYKCMSRPTTAALAGVIGASTMGAVTHAEYMWNTRRY